MESLNWVAIGVMTVISFMFGNLWFGVFFGKQWQRIHGMDCMDEKAKKAMMKGIWKIMLGEFLATAVIMIGIARMIAVAPEFGGIGNALFVWLMFVVPITLSNVVWGADKREVMIQKIAITIGYRLIPLVVAGYVFTRF